MFLLKYFVKKPLKFLKCMKRTK